METDPDLPAAEKSSEWPTYGSSDNAEQRSNWRSVVLGSLVTFVIWRVLIVLAGVFAKATLAPNPIFAADQKAKLGLEIWAQWDSAYYLSIASQGYAQPHWFAFFPLYPLTIRGPYEMGMPLLWAALLVNLVLAALGVVLLALLAAHLSDRVTAKRSALYLLVFPTAVFLATPYTESLYLAAAVGAFYAAERGKWGLAGLAGALASATRLTGVLIAPALLLLYIERRHWKWKSPGWKWLWILVVPVGVALYGAWSWSIGKGWVAFLDAQSIGWPERKFSLNLLETLVAPMAAGLAGRTDGVRGVYTGAVDFLAFSFAVTSLIVMWRKLPKAYFLYSLLVLLAAMVTSVTTSLDRYLLGMFPCFIVWAMLGRRESVDRLYTLTSAAGLGVMTALYVTGYWVG